MLTKWKHWHNKWYIKNVYILCKLRNFETTTMKYAYTSQLFTNISNNNFFEVDEILSIESKTLKTQSIYVQIYYTLHLIGEKCFVSCCIGHRETNIWPKSRTVHIFIAKIVTKIKSIQTLILDFRRSNRAQCTCFSVKVK